MKLYSALTSTIMTIYAIGTFAAPASAAQITPIELKDMVIYDGANDGIDYTWSTGLGGYYSFLAIGGAFSPIINANNGKIDSKLNLGDNTFYIFGDWDPIPAPKTITINLFFHPAIGGFLANNQDISAETENNTNAPFTSNIIVQPYPGSFRYVSGHYAVYLTDFNLSILDGTGFDRVSSFNAIPNGRRDAVGLFTLSVVDISAVPEPAMWASMIVGMGLLGTVMRYRRRGIRAIVG